MCLCSGDSVGDIATIPLTESGGGNVEHCTGEQTAAFQSSNTGVTLCK